MAKNIKLWLLEFFFCLRGEESKKEIDNHNSSVRISSSYCLVLEG